MRFWPTVPPQPITKRPDRKFGTFPSVNRPYITKLVLVSVVLIGRRRKNIICHINSLLHRRWYASQRRMTLQSPDNVAGANPVRHMYHELCGFSPLYVIHVLCIVWLFSTVRFQMYDASVSWQRGRSKSIAIVQCFPNSRFISHPQRYFSVLAMRQKYFANCCCVLNSWKSQNYFQHIQGEILKHAYQKNTKSLLLWICLLVWTFMLCIASIISKCLPEYWCTFFSWLDDLKLIYADMRVCIRYSYCKKSEIIRPSIHSETTLYGR